MDLRFSVCLLARRSTSGVKLHCEAVMADLIEAHPETAEYYEERAAQCLRSLRRCPDAATKEALRKLVDEYAELAARARARAHRASE
jgi:hypothetical protein